MKVMIDSSFLIGLIISNDQWHDSSMLMENIVSNNDTYITGQDRICGTQSSASGYPGIGRIPLVIRQKKIICAWNKKAL